MTLLAVRCCATHPIESFSTSKQVQASTDLVIERKDWHIGEVAWKRSDDDYCTQTVTPKKRNCASDASSDKASRSVQVKRQLCQI